MTTQMILIATTAVVFLLLLVTLISETRNVNGHILNLSAAIQMLRWYEMLEDTDETILFITK